MKEQVKYYCTKTYKGQFGTFYAGKIYTFQHIQGQVVYVKYHEEDMLDYYKNQKVNKLYNVVPGLKFSMDKNNLKSFTGYDLEYFYDYFSDIKGVRKNKLEKLNSL